MYDAVGIISEAFTKLMRRKGEFFLPGSNGLPQTPAALFFNRSREVNCATAPFRGSPIPFEWGEKIAKLLHKVSFFLIFPRIMFGSKLCTLTRCVCGSIVESHTLTE